ncbi:MAG: peptide deformylase [Myxococcaceae bacterium]
MAKPIVIWPDKVLQRPTAKVTDFGPALQTLLGEMMDSLREAEGIGIAANQIGVPLRLAWVGRPDGTFFEIVNPELLETLEPLTYEEGCLSVPGEFEDTPRFRKVKVRFQDRTGAWQTLEAEDRLAHVLQHEIDHLEGTVFVNRLSSLKRDLLKKKMLKLQKTRADEHAHPHRGHPHGHDHSGHGHHHHEDHGREDD